MNDFAFKQDAPGYRSAVDSSRVICDELGVSRRVPVARFEVVSLALRSTYDHHVRLAQAGGRRHERIQHSLEIEGRAAYHLEHVGSGGLLLTCLVKLTSELGNFRFQVGRCLQALSSGVAPFVWGCVLFISA